MVGSVCLGVAFEQELLGQVVLAAFLVYQGLVKLEVGDVSAPNMTTNTS